MPNERGPNIQINVPVNSDPATKRKAEELVIELANNPNKNLGFAEAAQQAGLLNKPEKPPYLLIGGVLLISYFLFFK